jgi:hypothetical protein
MGTKCAPSYATLTLGYLQELMFADIEREKGKSTLNKMKCKYFRYLDDFILSSDQKHRCSTK